MDVAGRFCCTTSDPWPWTGISAHTGTTFGTFRTLGTGINWGEISLCPPTDSLAQCNTYSRPQSSELDVQCSGPLL